MLELVFASANQGKIKEIHQILGHSFVINGLRDVGIVEEIPETGQTFFENAFQKANYVYQKCGCNVFADDSGLVVSALNGEPGVHSAIYAGYPKNDKKNIQLLLQKMQGVSDRSAYFISVICLIFQGKAYYFEGRVNGQIIEEMRGSNGFGYDPVFVPDGYKITFAEMDNDLKNQISHRNKALEKMKAFLIQNK